MSQLLRLRLVWAVAPLTAVACACIMAGLPAQAWARLAAWLLGPALDMVHASRHSMLREA